MRVEGAWRPVAVDDDRRLIFGPGVGRLYLVDGARAADPQFQRVLGLRGLTFDPDLADPADRVVHTRSSLSHPARVSGLARYRALEMVYRGLHWSRAVAPAQLALRRIAAAATGRVRTGRAAGDVGRMLHAVEHGAGFSDCYPRALTTLYLCLEAGLPCAFAIGVLSPTRKMHAWCSVEGALPYEAAPEHYMYEPLFVARVWP